MQPQDHDSSFGALEVLFRAYLGQSADDAPEPRSRALESYLRHTWHTRPAAVTVAARQLRRYAEHPPGKLRVELGEFFPMPDLGLASTDVQPWMLCVADHLERSAADGDVPPPTAVPDTHWEWHARFPELAQFLGGWFSQDMPDEFPDHEAALADYRATTHPALVARLAGELSSLLALLDDEGDHAVALVELGMEVEPPAPYSPGGWLAHLARVLGDIQAG